MNRGSENGPRPAGRRGLLRLATTGGALLVGLGAARRGGAAAQQGVPLVGSWQVEMSPQGGSDPFAMLATFGADGTVVASSPALSRHSTAHGAWTANQDGSFGVRAAFHIVLASQPGRQVLAVLRMTLTVATGGGSLSGPFDMQLIGADGTTITDILGTAQGTRI